MEISLEVLVEYLYTLDFLPSERLRIAVPNIGDATGRRLRGIELFPQERTRLSSKVLWFGAAEAFLEAEDGTLEGLCIVAIGEEEEFFRLRERNEGACLFYPSSVSMPVAFNEILLLFQRLEAWETQMDLVIARKKSLQSLVDISLPILKNPIVVWDNSFRFIARTAGGVPEIPVLQGWLDEGEIPGEGVEMFVRYGYLKNSDKFNSLANFNPPTYFETPFSLCVFSEGEKPVFTMAQYYIHRKASPAQKELLRIFEDKVKEYVEEVMPTGERHRQSIYEPFIWDLICERLRGKDDIMERLRFINLPYEGRYCVYQIEFTKLTRALASYMKSACRAACPRGRIVSQCKDRRLYLLDRRTDEDTPEVLVQRDKMMLRILRENDAICGASAEIRDLSQVNLAARQAAAAIRIGVRIAPETRLWAYPDLYFYDMALDYATRMGGFELPYFNMVESLRKNDQRTGNNNLCLLDIFLNNDRNITHTAKELCLHRNSVIYRLERIQETLGVSLDDPQMRFNLLLALRLQEAEHYFRKQEGENT